MLKILEWFQTWRTDNSRAEVWLITGFKPDGATILEQRAASFIEESPEEVAFCQEGKFLVGGYVLGEDQQYSLGEVVDVYAKLKAAKDLLDHVQEECRSVKRAMADPFGMQEPERMLSMGQVYAMETLIHNTIIRANYYVETYNRFGIESYEKES